MTDSLDRQPDQPREIFLRVWDKQHGRYLDDFFLGPSGEVMTGSGHGSFRTIYASGPWDNYITEFWTGLKDSDGKLVFEGDILSSPHNGNVWVQWFSLIYGYSAWWYEEEIDEDGEERYELTSQPLNHFVYDCYATTFYVAGTIHQNPELVKLDV